MATTVFVLRCRGEQFGLEGRLPISWAGRDPQLLPSRTVPVDRPANSYSLPGVEAIDGGCYCARCYRSLVIVTVLNRGKALKHMLTQSAISVQRDSRFMARVLSVF